MLFNYTPPVASSRLPSHSCAVLSALWRKPNGLAWHTPTSTTPLAGELTHGPKQMLKAFLALQWAAACWESAVEPAGFPWWEQLESFCQLSMAFLTCPICQSYGVCICKVYNLAGCPNHGACGLTSMFLEAWEQYHNSVAGQFRSPPQNGAKRKRPA